MCRARRDWVVVGGGVGPELLVRQSANITALMCSGNVGPKCSDGAKSTLWLLNKMGRKCDRSLKMSLCFAGSHGAGGKLFKTRRKL